MKTPRCKNCHRSHNVKGQYLLFCGAHQKMVSPRDSCPQFQEPPRIPKQNKFHAVRSTAVLPELAGRSFASKLERDRAVELVFLLRAGRIQTLTFQPSLRLTRSNLEYHPDFKYLENGRTVYEEAKGENLYPWKTYRRLWKWYGEDWLKVIRRGNYGNIVCTETIYGEGKFGE